MVADDQDGYAPTSRTELRRLPARGSYDRALVHAILDEALVAHLGVSVDSGPRVIPTTFARAGEVVYVHGSLANRTFRPPRAPRCASPSPCWTVWCWPARRSTIR